MSKKLNHLAAILHVYAGAVSNFHGTEIEIWAGFGPVGNTEKIYEQLLRVVFSTFFGQKKKKKLKA